MLTSPSNVQLYKNNLWALALGMIGLFYLINGVPLLDNNEGLYAEIAKEMPESMAFKNWVIPHLNGVPYIEKPPLLYWLTAGSYGVFGVSEASARLVPSISGLGIMIILMHFAHRHQILQDKEWLIPFMLGTSPCWLVMQRMVFSDGLLAFFMTLSLTQYYQFSLSQKSKNIIVSYGSLALAVMTKGLVALVLWGIVILGHMIYRRQFFRDFKSLLNPYAVGVFCVISVPWHILASQYNSDFLWFYFVNEHLYRFLDMREPRDYYRGPIYYYLPRILLYILPWSLFIFALGRRWFKKQSSLEIFLWIWFGGMLLFSSISKAKANYYMIVGLPPLILFLCHNMTDKMIFWGKWIGFSILIIFMVLLSVVPHFEEKYSLKTQAQAISKDADIYVFQDYENVSSLRFYVNRRIFTVDSLSSDLLYGQGLPESRPWFLTVDEFKRKSKNNFVLVVHPRRMSKLGDLTKGLCQKPSNDGILTIYGTCSP